MNAAGADYHLTPFTPSDFGINNCPSTSTQLRLTFNSRSTLVRLLPKVNRRRPEVESKMGRCRYEVFNISNLSPKGNILANGVVEALVLHSLDEISSVGLNNEMLSYNKLMGARLRKNMLIFVFSRRI